MEANSISQGMFYETESFDGDTRMQTKYKYFKGSK